MARSPSLGRHEIEALFRTYGPLVRRRARSILGNEHEAEDAVQDVFTRVLGALDEFRGESQPSTWLYRITTNLCLNRIRDGRRHRGRLEQLAASERVAGEQAAPPPVDARIALRALLAEVSDELAQIAVHYHIDEMDQEEIAAILGVSRRTVGYRLERFREEAQRFLGQPAAPAHEQTQTKEGVAASPGSRGPKDQGESS